MSESYDLVVIGSGPGGYVAAIRASQLGMKVACVERESLGGVCLNWGCIPSKALLKTAEYANTLRHIGDYGISVEGVSVDFPAVIARSRKVADKSEKGVRYLFRKYKVTAVMGDARLAGPNEVVVAGADGERTLTASKVIVATGARARWFPGMDPDGERVLTYREAIVRSEKPASAVILGAGAIGLEFAYFWNAIGVEVTLVEGADRIAPLEDAEVSEALRKSYKKLGVEVITGVFARTVAADGDRAKVALADGRELTAEVALLALGVRPNTGDLGLEALGVTLDRGGFIQTDADCRTNLPWLYAIGDVAGPPMLAHKASAEAHVCVERMAGLQVPDLDLRSIPGGTFCQPQVASVGYTEDQLKAEGIPYKVGRFPFAANGKNRGTGHTDGFVKVLIGGQYDEFLGAHIIGDNATELLAEVVLARAGELDAETFLHAVHSHPTSSEAVMEAVADALGKSVHI